MATPPGTDVRGFLTDDEGAMLSTLRETLGISEAQHATLLAELRDNIK